MKLFQCVSQAKPLRALGALPVALHEAGAGVEQPPAEQHRLAEEVAAVALAFGRLRWRQIDGLAHRVGRDHVERLRLIVADRLADRQLVAARCVWASS